MMICDALGAGADDCDVWVLCGAGGGSTVHPPAGTSDITQAAVSSLNGLLGTLFSVSTGSRRALE